MSIEALSSSSSVNRAIATASARTGVDFGYLFNQARVESALNPSAKAKTSSATGLFQFTRQTWLATVKEHGAAHGLGWAADAIEKGADGTHRITASGLSQSILDLRLDPDAASTMAAEFASDNRDFLARRLGRDVEPVDLYLAHFLGAGGAAQFLQAHDATPGAAAAPLFPAAAAANRGVFYAADGSARSLDDIRGSFTAKMHGAAPTRTAVETHATTRSRSSATVSLTMRAITPMPGKLSLDFARLAYARVAQDRSA